MREEIFKDFAREPACKRRLVEEENFGAADEHEGEPQKALLQGRERGDLLFFAEAEDFEEKAGAFGREVGEGLEKTSSRPTVERGRKKPSSGR